MPAGTDSGRGHDPVVVRRLTSGKDEEIQRAREAGLSVLEGRYSVYKYNGDSTDPADLYEIVETAPNGFLTAGINTVLKLAAAQAANAYNAANTRLAVGDGTGAFAAAQTDLQGANKYRQIVDAAPVISNNQITWAATFGTGVANFTGGWQEIGVVNAGSGGEMWSRTIQNMGVKTSSATWVLNWSLSVT